MIEVKFPLQSGQTAFTLDHSSRQVKQNLCIQVLVIDLLSSSPKQIGQVASVSGLLRPSSERDFRLTAFLLSLKDGGGVREPGGRGSGVGGQESGELGELQNDHGRRWRCS